MFTAFEIFLAGVIGFVIGGMIVYFALLFLLSRCAGPIKHYNERERDSADYWKPDNWKPDEDQEND